MIQYQLPQFSKQLLYYNMTSIPNQEYIRGLVPPFLSSPKETPLFPLELKKALQILRESFTIKILLADKGVKVFLLKC